MKNFNIINHKDRPNAPEYIKLIFPDFIALGGDRNFGDDPSVISGLASINGIPVTVIGQIRGRSIEENLKCNFSLGNPEGFRKALRMMKQAEKFHRPVINLVDTLGANPDIAAEEHGQMNAISSLLSESMYLNTLILSILIGNGNSGGALALSIANRLAILEHAVFGVITPKAGANILWKDSSREEEAMGILKMTANDLYKQGIVDTVLLEPAGGAHTNPSEMAETMKRFIVSSLEEYRNKSSKEILDERYKKYRGPIYHRKGDLYEK